MRPAYYLIVIVVLLSLVAVSPAIASASGTTNSLPGSSRYLTPLTISAQDGSLSPAALVTTRERFTRTADSYIPSWHSTQGNRFSSYIRGTTVKTSVFTESDNSRSVSIAKGQVVMVQLSENPSTGYHWEPAVSEGIQVTEDTYTPSSSGRMGAAGTRTWTLKATAKGEQYFTAEYKRPWEPGSIDTYTIHFIVS